VTVVNPGDFAKAEGIQQPYQTYATCSFGGGGFEDQECDVTIQTPATQRLVIEFVTGQCSLVGNNGIYNAIIGTTAGGNFVAHYLAVQPRSFPAPGNGTLQQTISQQLRIYADPLSTIEFNVFASGPNTPEVCFFTLSGQAVS
jgi:hypothetical protein